MGWGAPHLRHRSSRLAPPVRRRNGIVVYRTLLPWELLPDGGAVLDLGRVNDYASVFLGGLMVGRLDRDVYRRLWLPPMDPGAASPYF